MIKNVVFDIGNVLVDFRWRTLMEELGMPAELQPVFEKTIFGSHWWGELDRGIYEEAEIVRKLREDNREHAEEFELIWANRHMLVEPFDYAVPWIERLKESGLKIYLLSNYPRDIFTLHTECGCFPFLDAVDGKVVSAFVQLVKPDAEIYAYLMKEYHLKAPECVFIDDRKENVEAAEALGMNGIIFENYKQADTVLGNLLGTVQ